MRAALLSCLVAASALLATAEASLASSLEEIAIPSAALGKPMKAEIYRPDGAAPAAGWPVLYLLHGLHGCDRDWTALGGVQATLDRMIAAGKVRPMLVVMPDAGDSWYVNSAAVGGPGDYQTALLDDLPRAIEQSYPVRRDRGGRAIAGLSMGGFGALRLALTRPDRYVAVASLSGAIWQNLPADGASGVSRSGAEFYRRVDPATVLGGIDLPPDGRHFGAAFGAPFDPRRFNDANVFTLLVRRLGEAAPLPAIYLTVGDHDSHDLWRGSIALYETLMADGVAVDFRVTDGDHVWALWRRSIEDALAFFNSKIIDPVPPRLLAGAPARYAGAATTMK